MKTLMTKMMILGLVMLMGALPGLGTANDSSLPLPSVTTNDQHTITGTEDTTPFYSLYNIRHEMQEEQANLTPMTDTELSAVERGMIPFLFYYTGTSAAIGYTICAAAGLF